MDTYYERSLGLVINIISKWLSNNTTWHSKLVVEGVLLATQSRLAFIKVNVKLYQYIIFSQHKEIRSQPAVCSVL